MRSNTSRVWLQGRRTTMNNKEPLEPSMESKRSYNPLKEKICAISWTTKWAGCTSVTLCGTLQESKTTRRVTEILQVETGFQA